MAEGLTVSETRRRLRACGYDFEDDHAGALVASLRKDCPEEMRVSLPDEVTVYYGRGPQFHDREARPLRIRLVTAVEKLTEGATWLRA